MHSAQFGQILASILIISPNSILKEAKKLRQKWPDVLKPKQKIEVCGLALPHFFSIPDLAEILKSMSNFFSDIL